MSAPTPLPSPNANSLRQHPIAAQAPRREVRQSEVQREVRESASLPPPRIARATFADTLGRPPKPDPYKPTRWQKVRDTVCPCMAPPKVNRIVSARAERPRSRFFGNFDAFAAAPEPPASERA